MTDRRAATGAEGEEIAVRHLESRGLRILARNWRPSGAGLRGELDVVAADRETLVVAEVKTRRGDAFGGPLVAVTPQKQARVRRLAAAYLRSRPVGRAEVRFDVVGVVLRPGQAPEVMHVEGAF